MYSYVVQDIIFLIYFAPDLGEMHRSRCMGPRDRRRGGEGRRPRGRSAPDLNQNSQCWFVVYPE